MAAATVEGFDRAVLPQWADQSTRENARNGDGDHLARSTLGAIANEKTRAKISSTS